MKHLVAAFLATTAALHAQAPLTEQPLAEAKGSIQIPEGWKSTHEKEDGIFVYHFGKTASETGTSITLSVTTKVPDRTGQPPSGYANALLEMAIEGNSDTPIVKGELNGLPSLRCEYDFEGEEGVMRAVNVAVPNDKTGTLYFFAWQAPVADSAELDALREKILASAKFDPNF